MSAPPPSVPARFNLTAAVFDRRAAAGDMGRVAIHESGRTHTYDDVARLAAKVRHALAALDVRREDRVLIALPDSAAFAASYFGTLALGAVAVPCNTFLGPIEYTYFLQESRAAVVITTADVLARVDAAVHRAGTVRAVLVVDREDDDGVLRSWSRWVAGNGYEQLDPADTHKDAPAFWLWTSGSTGTPKAAVHLHQDWPWCCDGFGAGVLGLSPSDRLFSAAKLFHAYGLGNGLLFPFWFGAPVAYLPDRAAAPAVLAVAERFQPTVFFAVPTIYASLLATTAASAWTSLRLAVSAGEPLPADLYRRWRAATGIDVLDAIGSTEVLHCYLSARPGQVKAGSVGREVPGYAMRIVDERGHDVRAGEEGELLVSGPSTAPYYWQRREQTIEKMRGPWFASGDRYRRDADGDYWHIGRADDMFKVSGEWCSSTEIEAILTAHPAVVECAVVPHPDDAGIVKPRAVVVLAPGADGGDALADDLRAFVKARTAHYKSPRVVDFVPELPKTATGKIQRFRLRS